jgi:hypothetical protein
VREFILPTEDGDDLDDVGDDDVRFARAAATTADAFAAVAAAFFWNISRRGANPGV